MAERAKSDAQRTPFPRTRTFGNAAVSAKQRAAWLWSRESLLRLGLSLVLAVALWLYVTDKQNPTRAWDYPYPISVAALNVTKPLTLTNNLDVVHVRIQADQNTTQVTSSSFHAFVDLNRYRRGLHQVKVNVFPDPGIQVLGINPPSIPVVLDAVRQVQVPVRPHFFGKPPEGYQSGPFRSNYSTVTVSGPETAISQVAQAAIYIPLSGVTSSFRQSYRVTLEDQAGNTLPPNALIKVSPSDVYVTVPITQLSSFKTLPVVASPRGQPKRGFGVVGVSVKPTDIIAYGSPSALGHVSSLSTQPINVSNRQKTFTIRTRLILPKGVSSPTHDVTVQTQIKPVDSSSSVEIGITPLNVAPGLVVHMRGAKVLATLVGPSVALQSAASTVSATIDLTGYGAGTFYVQPKVNVPGSLRLETVYPSRVAVVLNYNPAG